MIPAPFIKELLENLYQQNQLVNTSLKVMTTASGERRKDGANSTQETIDLEEITIPVLNIVGNFDDICPPAASLPLEDMVAANDKSTVKVPCGHIELSVSAYAHERLWPQVVEW